MSGDAVRFGIAGWSYADWRGVVYPRGCSDTLRHVASFVDFIEINSTFYRLPAPSVASFWAGRIADIGTFFTAKLPRAITHEGRLDRQLAAEVRASMQPLCEADRLRMMLAQFSYRFTASGESLAFLRRLAEAFRWVPLALEVRHASWRAPDAQRAVAELGMSLAHLDYPGAFDGAGTAISGSAGTAYFRVHGRNRSAWFSKEAGRDQVYDYLYSQREVAQLEERIEDLARTAETTLVVANNHFHGKAMKLVLELMAWYRGGPQRVPEVMIEAWPELRRIARGVQGGLFE